MFEMVKEAHARRYNQKTAPSIRTDTLQNGARTRDSRMRKALLFASDPSPFSFLVLRFHHSLVLTVRFSFTTHAPHSHTGPVNYWKTYIYSPRARTLMYRDREMRQRNSGRVSCADYPLQVRPNTSQKVSAS